MRVAVIGANLGGFDNPVPHCPQEGVEVYYHLFTDANMPPRSCAMTPRLQAKIPKMFAWDLCPGYDAYIWCDSSLRLSKPDSVLWFLNQLGDYDIAVFKHPARNSAREEAAFLRAKLAVGSEYIMARYAGEDIDGQMEAIRRDRGYADDRLYAAGAFCYKPTCDVRDAMKEWWYHTSRFHQIDQLSFPYALWTNRVCASVIDEDIYHASHLEWVRRRGHA